MSRSTPSRTSKRRIGAGALAIALVALLAAALASGAHQQSKRVATKTENATLGKTILATLAGRTLYSLSAETNGRFICTGSCLEEWLPLTVPAGTKPAGPVKLGTIKRPDNGRRQVTYKGRPLYRFDGDRKRGDANGEGIKDVGTWHAAAVAGPSKSEPTPQPQPENPYGY
ncbi:MAG: COG4315 family predicted lipoprotein [Solirubrobacterales bacterium]